MVSSWFLFFSYTTAIYLYFSISMIIKLRLRDKHKLTCGSKTNSYIKRNEVEFGYTRNVMNGAE